LLSSTSLAGLWRRPEGSSIGVLRAKPIQCGVRAGATIQIGAVASLLTGKPSIPLRNGARLVNRCGDGIRVSVGDARSRHTGQGRFIFTTGCLLQSKPSEPPRTI
jgi:hypothetical protein